MHMHRLAVVLVSVVLLLADGCGDVSKPEVPVIVTYRESLLGQGLVLQLNNQTNTQLTVTLVVNNEEKNYRKEGAINIPPNGQVEIGWLEGWRFESGETVTISHPNFKSRTWRIP